MKRIKVPLPPTDEKKKVIEDVDKDRRYAIDAAIVRTMKSRKVRSWVVLLLLLVIIFPTSPFHACLLIFGRLCCEQLVRRRRSLRMWTRTGATRLMQRLCAQ
jgi:hypothetical protein